jgi:hypothetical protein
MAALKGHAHHRRCMHRGQRVWARLGSSVVLFRQVRIGSVGIQHVGVPHTSAVSGSILRVSCFRSSSHFLTSMSSLAIICLLHVGCFVFFHNRFGGGRDCLTALSGLPVPGSGVGRLEGCGLARTHQASSRQNSSQSQSAGHQRRGAASPPAARRGPLRASGRNLRRAPSVRRQKTFRAQLPPPPF